MNPIPASTFRHGVIIQQAVETRASDGGIVETWEDAAAVWADVRELSGRELEIARTAYADATHKVTLNFIGGITNRMRIKFGSSRILNIIHASNVEERGVYSVLICKEKLG
jgi:SPP1 family predicted phage head-tail adaptor